MEFLTRKEVAKYLRVGERTVDRWLAAEKMKGYKLGDGRNSQWRIPKLEIKKFLDRHSNKKKHG